MDLRGSVGGEGRVTVARPREVGWCSVAVRVEKVCQTRLTCADAFGYDDYTKACSIIRILVYLTYQYGMATAIPPVVLTAVYELRQKKCRCRVWMVTVPNVCMNTYTVINHEYPAEVWKFS